MSDSNTVQNSSKSSSYPLVGKIVASELRDRSAKPGQFRYLRVEYTSKRLGKTLVTAATAFGRQTMDKLAGLAVGDTVNLVGEFSGPGFTIRAVNLPKAA